jgi:hypothetical protein
LCANIILAFGCVGRGEREEEREREDIHLSEKIELYVFFYYINKFSSMDVALGKG